MANGNAIRPANMRPMFCIVVLPDSPPLYHPQNTITGKAAAVPAQKTPTTSTGRRLLPAEEPTKYFQLTEGIVSS